MEKRKASKRKVLEGSVVSNKRDKTVTVRVDRRFRHPHLQKVIVRGKKYHAHNEKEEIPNGSKVRIEETRPISKLKRWRVVEILS